MIRAVIFDMDGTIVDTEGTAQAVIEEALQSWGVEFDPRDKGLVNGRTWEAGFEILFAKYPIPLRRADAEEEILSRYRKAMSQELRVIPGVIGAIQSIAERFPLALVSGSHRQEILFALNQIGVRDHFAHVFGAEDYPRSKPAPDGYLSASKAMNVLPAECLVFEDSVAGIASARSAGMIVVAVTHANPFGESHAAAHSRIPNFEGIDAQWVQRYS